ncbi:T9SS type A sorting domain-containing protein [Paraflavisolibacter sp. H34]|uniref:T9SS type A sorting domain-containing protein n=1 Tax=Huijunlia imazamoxiresistens TaxID=3127457 RepID=UPI0030199DB9
MKKLFTSLLLAALLGATSLPATAASLLPTPSATIAPAKARIKIIPGTLAKGTLTVLTHGKKLLFFYVFDLDGRLVHHSLLKGKQKKTITGLPKGLYTYDVFENNESIEQGRIAIK